MAYGEGRYDDALRFYAQAIKEDKRNGRALQEDLSYSPAHLQLAFMALDAKDTATALTELDLVTQLRPDDASAQFFHGYILANTGNALVAEPHIKKAIQLDPVYAAPKFVYAFLLESAGFTEEAIATYKEFLAAAARTDPRRQSAEARLAALTKPGHQDIR
jgi:tetratricopeptide (TPR) repeat protein